MRAVWVVVSLAIIAFDIGALAAGESGAKDCQKPYEKIYVNDQVNMTFATGVMTDGDGTSRDAIVRAEFIQALTRRCEGDENLCGFARSADDAELFTKTIKGPDGKEKFVRFRVLSSCSMAKGFINTECSKAAFERFSNALQSDQVVVFQGHAQSGYGPSIGNQQLEIEAMADLIGKAKTKPAVIGMLSCDAEVYYGNKLHEAAPDAALVLTRQKTMIDDGLRAANATFELLLGHNKCEDQAKAAFRKATDFFYYGPWEFQTEAAEMRKTPAIFGLFRPDANMFPEVPKGAMLNKYHDQRRDYSPGTTSN